MTEQKLTSNDEARIEAQRKRRTATVPRGTIRQVLAEDDVDREIIGHGTCRFCGDPAPISRFLRDLVVDTNSILAAKNEKPLTRDDVALCDGADCRKSWELERDVHVHRLDILVDDCIAKAGRGEPFQIPDVLVKNRATDVKRIRDAVAKYQGRDSADTPKRTGKLQ